MKPDRKDRKFYFVYSIIFLIMTALVFSCFFLHEKTFVGREDGWDQHFRALLFYSRWLKETVKNIFVNHTLDFPVYTFGIGYGGDMLTTLSYYAVGDPLNLFSGLVPEKYMVHFYDFLVLLRIYLAGLAFYRYISYRNVAKTGMARMAGVFMYDFCGYSLLASVRHPFFMNPMIYFPLVLLGVEKIKKERKPLVFIFSVFLSAVSNYYFFYMIAIFTGIYVIFRIFMWYGRGKGKEAAIFLLKLAGYAVIGVMMGAVLLCPIILTILKSPRLGADTPMMLSYPLSYLGRFPGAYLTWQMTGRWTVLGFAAVVLLAVYLMFQKMGEYRALKIAFVMLTVFLLVPVCGYVFSGFSNITNRWCWCYAMLLSYILVVMWEDLYSVSKKQQKGLIIFAVAYVLLSVTVERTVTGNKCGAVVIMALTLFVMLSNAIRRKWSPIMKETAVFCLMLFNICITAFFEYAPSQGNYIGEYMTFNEIEKTAETEDSKILELSDETAFYRYTGTSMPLNSALVKGLFGVQSYWSLVDGGLSDYYYLLALHDNSSYRLRYLDSRTALNSIAGVKYFVVKNKKSELRKVPYGYHLAAGQDEDADFLVYENEYALPFAFTYQKYLTREQFETLTPLQRQEMLVNGIVLEEETGQDDKVDFDFRGQKLDYEVACDSKEVTLQDHSFVVTKDNSSVTLTFSGVKDAETYFYITGLDFKETKNLELYTDDAKFDPLDLYRSKDWEEMTLAGKGKLLAKDFLVGESDPLSIKVTAADTKGRKTSAEIRYLPKDYIYYCGRHDFLVNLYYGKRAKTSVTLTFPYKGIYSFETMEMLALPMEGYDDAIRQLGEESIENLDFHMSPAHTTNEISGTIQTEGERFLYLSMSYSKGWTAYVDGEKQELLPANIYGSALRLTEGEHEIKLVYKTPGLAAGILLSLAGCLAAAVVAILQIFLKRQKI